MPTLAELKAKAEGVAAKPKLPTLPATAKTKGAAPPAVKVDAAAARASEGSKAAKTDVVHTSGKPVAMAGHYPQNVEHMPSIDEVNARGTV